MDLSVFKLGNGEPMANSPSIGLPILWMEEEVKNKTEDEFWEWIVDLNNNWYNENHLKSIEKRRELNKNIIPADFDIQLLICLSMIFLQSQDEWTKRGLNPIPR